MAVKVGISDCGESKIETYERAVREVGLTPVRIVRGQFSSLDGLYGLLLTGGADINPKRYGQQPHEKTQPPDDERDELELSLAAEALAVDLPIFAICRGMQLLNVSLHGTLTQHLPSANLHVKRNPDEQPGRHRDAHKVTVLPGTRLAEIMGVGEHLVNSRHHQAVDRTGPDVLVSALSEDGVTEAIEIPSKRFAIAVQWHPEDRIDSTPADRMLFEAFAASVSGGSSDRKLKT